MDWLSHAGSPFAYLASFPMTSRRSKEVWTGERSCVGGVVDHLWWLWALFYSNSDCSIWSSVVRQRFQCGEQGGGLAFSVCYKICSLYNPPNLSTRSFFLFVLHPTLISSITPIFPVVYLVILEECVKWTVLSPQKLIVLKYCLLICSLLFLKKRKKNQIKKHLIAYISILFISNICNQISTILHLHIMCDGDLFLNHYLQKMFFSDWNIKLTEKLK